jgi:hypothetical protein
VLKFLPAGCACRFRTYLYGLTSITVHERGGHPSSFFGKPSSAAIGVFPGAAADQTPLLGSWACARR